MTDLLFESNLQLLAYRCHILTDVIGTQISERVTVASIWLSFATTSYRLVESRALKVCTQSKRNHRVHKSDRAVQFLVRWHHLAISLKTMKAKPLLSMTNNIMRSIEIYAKIVKNLAREMFYLEEIRGEQLKVI